MARRLCNWLSMFILAGILGLVGCPPSAPPPQPPHQYGDPVPYPTKYSFEDPRDGKTRYFETDQELRLGLQRIQQQRPGPASTAPH